MKDLINEKTQNDENTHSSKSKRGNQKLVNIEEQYEGDNDKTLLQVATDNGNVEALKVWFEQLKSLPVIEIIPLISIMIIYVITDAFYICFRFYLTPELILIECIY